MLLIAIVVIIATAILTGLIRYYALAKQVLDIPNQRSSHTTPTARGGGLAIVLIFSAATIYLLYKQVLNPHWFLALNSTLLVAGIVLVASMGASLFAVGFWHIIYG